MLNLTINNRLFVYGTLRQLDPTGKTALIGSADYLGIGKIHGSLFNLGEYPGVVASEAGEDEVTGEVYELADFPQQIIALDQYEGCDPATPQPHEYRREIATVMMANGQKIEAWVYFYLGFTKKLEKIASGDWLAP